MCCGRWLLQGPSFHSIAFCWVVYLLCSHRMNSSQPGLRFACFHSDTHSGPLPYCVKLIERREWQKRRQKRAKSQNSPGDWKCLKLLSPKLLPWLSWFVFFIWLIKKLWQKNMSNWATAFRLLEEFNNDKDWQNAFLNKSRKIICPEALFLSYCSNK